MPRQSTHCTGHSVYHVWPPAVKIRIQTDRKGRAETFVIVLLPSHSILFSLICLSKIIRWESISGQPPDPFLSRLRAVRAHPRGHQDSVLTKIRLEKGLLAHTHASWRKFGKKMICKALLHVVLATWHWGDPRVVALCSHNHLGCLPLPLQGGHISSKLEDNHQWEKRENFNIEYCYRLFCFCMAHASRTFNWQPYLTLVGLH